MPTDPEPMLDPRRPSEELTRRILETVPGGVVHVAADGAILHANREALRILGLRYDELTRRYTTDFDQETIGEDGAPFPAADYPVTRALVTGEEQAPATIGMRRPDGTVSWAVFRAMPVLDPESGRTSGAIVTFLDITERKRAEEAARAEHERWRALAENIPDFASVIDKDGRMLFVNRTIDVPAHDVIGSLVTDWVVPEERAYVMDRIAHTFATGETVRFEARGRGPQGKTVLYEEHLGPIREGGEVVAAVLVSRDVSERVALLEQLGQSERMASVGLLAAGVAHEINNPLTYVLANLSYLLERRSFEAQDREVLEEALEGAQRVRDIIRDLRTFSRDDRRVDEAVLDVHPILDAAIQMAQHELRQRARVTRDYGHLPCVLASEARLGQVVLNLLVNAAQAIPADAAQGKIVVATSVDGDGVAIEIRDDGAGIAPEHLPRIFDPFFTTKPVGQGTGLGLSICHNFVEAMKGRITVASELGRGTTVRVRLRAAREASPEAPPPAAPANAAIAPKRVLVVDDDAKVARGLSRMLAPPHAVTVASSAEEALAMLAEGAFDLVLCDVMMPGGSGLEIHAEVLARDPALAERFVFLTGGVFSPSVTEALARTGRPCLRKPVDGADVLELLAGA